MENMGRWDLALGVVVCAIAIVALVRLMRSTRDRLLAQIRDKQETTKGPRRLRDKIARPDAAKRDQDEAA